MTGQLFVCSFSNRINSSVRIAFSLNVDVNWPISILSYLEFAVPLSMHGEAAEEVSQTGVKQSTS